MTLGAKRTDERDDHHQPRIHEKARDFRGPAHVFYTVGVRVSKIIVEAATDIVAIEHIGVPSGCE